MARPELWLERPRGRAAENTVENRQVGPVLPAVCARGCIWGPASCYATSSCWQKTCLVLFSIHIHLVEHGVTVEVDVPTRFPEVHLATDINK